MLTYLLGDVLRIFSGDMTAGEIQGVPATQGMWLGIAAIMLVPILMLVLTLILPHPAIRWVNIIGAVLVIIWRYVKVEEIPFDCAQACFAGAQNDIIPCSRDCTYSSPMLIFGSITLLSIS